MTSLAAMPPPAVEVHPLIVTDGRRRCFEQMWVSAETMLNGVTWARPLVVDDSQDDDYAAWLDDLVDGSVIHLRGKAGLSGAIRVGWEAMLRRGARWVFHLEDDWVFPDPVDVGALVGLCAREKLAQVALKRGPVHQGEVNAGGFMEFNPHNYEDRNGWVESFFGFTLNPCVYPAETMDVGWPVGGGEAEFTAAARRANPRVRFGLYGQIGDPPRTIHIGHTRSRSWRL